MVQIRCNSLIYPSRSRIRWEMSLNKDDDDCSPLCVCEREREIVLVCERGAICSQACCRAPFAAELSWTFLNSDSLTKLRFHSNWDVIGSFAFFPRLFVSLFLCSFVPLFLCSFVPLFLCSFLSFFLSIREKHQLSHWHVGPQTLQGHCPLRQSSSAATIEWCRIDAPGWGQGA